MKNQFLLLCLVLSMINSVFSANVNILTNGSFEIPGDSSTDNYDLRLNPQILSGWQYDPTNRWAVGASGVNGFFPNDYSVYPGQFSTSFGNRWIFFGSGSADPGGKVEQYFNLPVGIYRASVWAKGYGYTGQPVSLTFGVFESQAGGWGEGGSLSVNPIFGDWTEYFFEFQVNHAQNFGFVIMDSTPLGSAPSADLYVDNAILQLVPEPSSLSLLTFSLSMWIITKRRR